MIVFVCMMILGIYLANALIVALAFLVLAYAFVLIKNEKSKIREQVNRKAVEIYNKYEMTKYYVGNDALTGVGINESSNTILFLSRDSTEDEFSHTTIRFEELFEVKLIEDDMTVTSISRASQLGGAIVGGILAGGVGAIIGGSGGKQYSENMVKRIELQFVIDSLTNPVYKTCFMNEDAHIDKHDKKYKMKFEIVNNWYKMFEVIIKRNEKVYKQI